MKRHDAFNDRKRPLYFNLGLLIALAAVLISFEWKVYTWEDIVDRDFGDLFQNIEDDIIPITIQKEVELPKPKIVPPGPEIKIADPRAELVDQPQKSSMPNDLDGLRDITYTRDDNLVDDTPKYSAEFEPVFPGGMKALKQFIKSELHYPEIALENDIQGKVFVNFVIERDGSVSNVKVRRGIQGGKMCDAEAMRVITKLPKWTPARQGFDTVRFYYMIPIDFKIVH